jgi:type IV secretory pathway component VirB8
MNEKYEHVKDLYNKNQYFKDAIGWYKEIYVYPFHTRVVNAIFMIIFGLGIYISFQLVSSLLPLHKIENIVYARDREEDDASYFTKLSEKNENPFSVVGKKLSEQYVIIRESADYPVKNIKLLNDDMANVKYMSSTKVSLEFEKSNIKDNKNSKLYYFLNNLSSSVKIIKSYFIQENDVDMARKVQKIFLPEKMKNKVIIEFETTSELGNKKMRAEISFVVKMNIKTSGHSGETISNKIHKFLSSNLSKKYIESYKNIVGFEDSEYDPRIQFIITSYDVSEISE